MPMHNFLRSFLRIKGLGFILLALVLGVLLVFLSGRMSDGTDAPAEGSESFSFEHYEHGMEERLEDLISRIDGVSSVSVMVLLDQSYEEIGEGANFSRPIGDTSGNTKVAPKVRGVAVVCRGGERSETRKEIIGLLSSLLGLPTNRIYVGGIG